MGIVVVVVFSTMYFFALFCHLFSQAVLDFISTTFGIKKRPVTTDTTRY